jgi:regulator of sigma E protease
MDGSPIVLIFSFAIILVPLIFIHELGHFIMAKLVGITVLEFGIGFPPRAAVLFKRGDTEYTLNWLPLGGFVRPLGEDFVSPMTDEEIEEDRQQLERDDDDHAEENRGVAVNDVSPPKRILFMVGGPLFNVLAAVLLFAVAAVLGKPDIDYTNIVVTSLPWNSPLVEAGLRPHDSIRAADGLPLDIAQDFYEYMETHAGQPVTLTVERDGVQFDLLVDAPENMLSRAIDGSDITIAQVNDDSPAKRAGLSTDDIVLALRVEGPYPAASLGLAEVQSGEDTAVRNLDSDAVYTGSALSYAIRAAVGYPVTFTIMHDAAPRRLTVETRTNPPEGEGATGIAITDDYPLTLVHAALPDALASGAVDTLETIVNVIRAPIMILTGEIRGEEARPLGIVGISQVGGEFIEESVELKTPAPALTYAAIISIALGVTNLLPLPALDGGRIIFTLIEMIRGKRMDPAREGMIHFIGLMALMALMILILIADIVDPIQFP